MLNKLRNIVTIRYSENLASINTNYSNVIQYVIKFISFLDFIMSNVKTATKYKYCKPEIDKREYSYIDCENLRHPIIERIIDYTYVPHTIELGKTKNGMLIYGINSCGKCFHKKTKILLYDCSWKYAIDVQEGDLLMGDDCTPRTVISTIQGRDILYNIQIENNDKIIVTGDHILCLANANLKTEEIVEITVKDYILNKHKYLSAALYTTVIDTNIISLGFDVRTFANHCKFKRDDRSQIATLRCASLEKKLEFINELCSIGKAKKRDCTNTSKFGCCAIYYSLLLPFFTSEKLISSSLSGEIAMDKYLSLNYPEAEIYHYHHYWYPVSGTVWRGKLTLIGEQINFIKKVEEILDQQY